MFSEEARKFGGLSFQANFWYFGKCNYKMAKRLFEVSFTCCKVY
jgi:hypothetical protein